MVNLTLLELHFEDSDLTANAPYSRGRKDVLPGGESPEEDTSSGKGKLFGLVVGLGFSIAVAYLVRKRVFGGEYLDEKEEERSRLGLRA